MKILSLQSCKLTKKLSIHSVGTKWEVVPANSPEQVQDHLGTQAFQAAVIDLDRNNLSRCRALTREVLQLEVPVTIGFSASSVLTNHVVHRPFGVDVILPLYGDLASTKVLCDDVIRLALGRLPADIVCNEVVYHSARDMFSVNGKDVDLQPKLHRLLELFFLNADRVVTNDMVFNYLYGWGDAPSAKAIDVFVYHIRRKLRDHGCESGCVETVWGRGYKVTRNRQTLVEAA